MTKTLRVILTMMILLGASTVSAQSIDEPRFVNKILDDFSTPVIEPGHTGRFSFTVNNPDPQNLTGNMDNVTLLVSIYQYATLEESMLVSEIDTPPVIVESQTTELTETDFSLGPGETRTVTFTIATGKDTPHGSYFSQSTYFVRFRLEFDYEGEDYTMASRGYFDDVQWDHLTNTGSGAGEVNRTYLEELGYQGIIPDSGFALKIPIPMWPFYLLVIFTAFVGSIAFCFYVLDNPGRYPKLEGPILRMNGKMAQLKATLLRRKR